MVQVCCYFVVLYIHFTHSQEVIGQIREKERQITEKERQITVKERQITADKELALMRAQQQVTSPKRGSKRGSASIPSDSDAPNSKASKHSEGSVHEQTAFCLKTRVVKGASHLGFRKVVFECAFQHVAYDGVIKYDPVAGSHGTSMITAESNLIIVLYFERKHYADAFEIALTTECERHRLTLSDVTVTHMIHKCEKKVNTNQYDPDHSADRGGCSVSEPSEPKTYTTVVDEETSNNQYVIRRDDPFMEVPQSCHLLERRYCNKTADADKANRIILPAGLHGIFDLPKPRVTFYCTDTPKPTSDHQRLRLHAQFATEEMANGWSQRLKDAEYSGGNDVVFHINQPRAGDFVTYLNYRHKQQLFRMGIAQISTNHYEDDCIDDLEDPPKCGLEELKNMLDFSGTGLESEGRHICVWGPGAPLEKRWLCVCGRDRNGQHDRYECTTHLCRKYCCKDCHQSQCTP